MTLFIAVCALLLALSGVFFLIPAKKRGGTTDQDLERANLEWYRLRQQELAEEGNDSLAADAQLRLLEDEQVPEAIHTRAASARRFPAWLLLPLVAVFSIVMYHQLGGAQDVMISRQLQALDDTSTPQQMEALMQAIEKRAAQRPDNLHYIAMLGRFYMGAQDYARAAQAYDELTLAAPEDAAGLAYAAQARYLAAGRVLDDSAKMRAEQALAIDPHQRTALGLLGMAAYEQAQYRAAIGYWQRLLAVETPGSESQRMIAGIIDSAREKLGEPVAAVAPTTAVPAVATTDSLGVTVSVAAPEGSVIDAADTVFVLARDAASDSRMPIAVQRLRGADLPLTLRLDDSNSMAGQKLSQADSVLVVVQVSPGGRPGEANATWLGSAGPLAPTANGSAVDIVLVPNNSASES